MADSKKDDNKKEVAPKKTAPKKSPIKSAPKKATASKKIVAQKKVAAPKKAVLKKKADVLSKGKAKKLRVEEKFSGRKYVLGIGKRKSAIAQVRIYEKGKGEIFVNNTPISEYFYGVLTESALQPLLLAGAMTEFDITVKVSGGGISAQSDAVRHGISRALVEMNPDTRILLKKSGLLTRDARVKERKKPGLKRARRAPQWNKR